MSNKYALGYTYQNVLDADQEDVLARLNVYMLSDAAGSPQLGELLRPLFAPGTVKEMLVTVLLDWEEPVGWARQLRRWVRLLRGVIGGVDEETRGLMEESVRDWRERRVGVDAVSSQAGAAGEGAEKVQQATPMGPGEWDEALGVPLSVVCIQSEKIERLERDLGWQDEHFDFLTQWLRCVLLKHGASLVYTASFDGNHVRTLLHSTLGIHSLLKREVAKPNYIERDKILIPPNWDSWGKIRPLREGTDLEAISDAWSVEIQADPDDTTTHAGNEPSLDGQAATEPDSAVGIYESTLPTPPTPTTGPTTTTSEDTTQPATVQEFLASQLTILESLKADDEKAAKKNNPSATTARRIATTGTSTPTTGAGDPARMTDQIGPYQINVNGIDFDAEEATRRLKEREAERNATATTSLSAAAKPAAPVGSASGTGSGVSTPTRRAGTLGGGGAGSGGEEGKASNEAMSAFFQNLIKKDRRGQGSGSERGGVSPSRGGSPAPGR